jgi:hypothetical protein
VVVDAALGNLIQQRRHRFHARSGERLGQVQIALHQGVSLCRAETRPAGAHPGGFLQGVDHVEGDFVFRFELRLRFRLVPCGEHILHQPRQSIRAGLAGLRPEILGDVPPRADGQIIEGEVPVPTRRANRAHRLVSNPARPTTFSTRCNVWCTNGPPVDWPCATMA